MLVYILTKVNDLIAVDLSTVLLADRDVGFVTGCCEAERIRQDIHVPSGRSGVRSVAPRPSSQMASKQLKVGFYKH